MKKLFTLGILLALMTIVPLQNVFAQTSTKLQVTLTTEAGQPGYLTCPQEHNAINPSATDKDGDGVPAMIDGNPSTYMHTAWKNVPAGPHYFQVDLGDGNALSSFAFDYQTRSGEVGYDFPAEFTIKGSNDDSNYEQITVLDVSSSMIGAGREYNSERIDCTKTYRYLRFEVTDTDDANGGTTGYRTYFHIAEFKLYEYEDYVPVYNVTVSVNDDTLGSATKSLTGEEIYSLTATANSGCAFKNWTINGVEVSTENPYSYTATADVEIVANFEKVYFTDFGTSTSSGKGALSKITFNINGEAQDIATGKENSSGAIYVNKVSEVVTVVAGEEVSSLTTTGSVGNNWMHGYLYVDWNNDKSFTKELNNYIPTENSELIAYGFWSGTDGDGNHGGVSDASGYNHKGNTINDSTTPNRSTNGALESFTIPANIPAGDYRARYKLDWNCINPEAVLDFAYGAMVLDFTLRVEQPVPTYTVTVTPSDATMGTVSPETATIAEGQTVTISAIPNEGYEFVKWTVDGGDGPNTNPWTVPVTEDLDFVANFQLAAGTVTYPVSVSVNDPAMGSASASVSEVIEGKTVTLTASANEGYRFVNWTSSAGELYYIQNYNTKKYLGYNSVNLAPVDTQSSDVTVASSTLTDGAFTFHFTGATYDQQTPPQPQSYMHCGSNGRFSGNSLNTQESQQILIFKVEDPTAETITATQATEIIGGATYMFVGLKSGVYYALTDELYEEGTTGQRLVGAEVTITDGTITFAPGTSSALWTINSKPFVSTENPCTATITAETAFVANFEAIPTYTVTVLVNDESMGSVSPGTSTVEEGTSVTLTASANEGAAFVNWTVNGEEVSTNPTYTFTVNTDVEVKANFEHAYCTPSVTTQGTDASYVGQIVTLTTTGAAVDANWTNPKTENFNGSTSVIENTFTAEAGQPITLNIVDKNTVWGCVSVYVDLNGNYIFEEGEQIFADAARNRTTPISQQFIIANTVAAGTYLMRVMYTDADPLTLVKWACDSYTQGGYYDFEFNVTAPLVLSERTITVKANNDAWGTVEGGATSTGRVTISATANEGYQFVNWTIEGDDTFSSTSTTYVDETAGSKTYIANFDKLPEDAVTLALIDAAKELLGQDGVGFPSNSERTLLQSAVATAEANPYAGAATALQTAINAYISTANIKIPEAGKAYAFVLAVNETSLYYINNSDGTLTAVSYDGTSTLPETAKFITSIVDGNKYAFQSVVDNKYMAIPSNEDWMTEESQSATGLDESVSVVSKFDVSKLVAGMNSFVTAEADQLLGMVYLSASRGIKTETSEPEAGVIIITSGGAFDKSGAPYCNGNFTSAIRMVEVDYTPTYAVSVEASPADGGELTASATEVEEGETVNLSALANEGYNFVNWTVNGVEVSTSESFTSEAINEETTFVANFVKKTYTVTVTATAGGTATTDAVNPVEHGTQITLTADANDGYEFVVWMVDGSEGARTDTWTIPVTEDLDFEAQFRLIQQGDKDVTVYDATEVNDAAYATVRVANEKVWDLQTTNIVADKVSVKVESNGVAPEVKISDGGQITTVLEISRVVEKGKWALMSLPFAVDLANVTVDGAPAANNSNIKVMVYDAAYRAANSVEDWTKSGWVDLVGTTIAANQGFAVAINANNGDEQTVTFTATAQTYDGADKQIALSRYASTVNGGADADWNFYGNPTLAKAQKGTGYALYVYNAEDDSYEEYASSDVATYLPYAAWFVQSADDFNAMSFSAGVAGALAEANGVYGELQFSLNGEDEARVVLVDDASEEYVRNEDALYFPAMNANLSQLYLVKGNMKMAVSEQPALTNMAMGYKAVKAGEQTLTLTSIPENASVVLVDNVAGTETAMTLGDTYTFQSEAGTFNNRFVIETTDLTGIAQAVADGEVKVIVSGDDIKVYGAEAGTEVVAYTTNGTVVASAVATDGVTTLSTTASGVIVVKVANTTVKVIK